MLLAPLALLVVLAAAAAAVAMGRRQAARLEAEVGRRLRLGAGGIVVGAEPIRLGDDTVREAPAVLLLHGGGDTPQALRYLAEHLHARGYAVRAPLLPGHGRTVRDFARVRAEEWTAAVRAEYRALRDAHDWVAVIGLSMGGALAVQLAAETPELPGLGLVAPYLAMPGGVVRAARTAPLWRIAAPYVASGSGRSIHDPVEAAHSLAYGVFTPGALRALYATVRRAHAALPRVQAPTIVVQSREDNRIGADAAEAAFARLGARDKRFVWVEGCGHVLTVDYGRARVIALLTDWLDRHR